MLVGGAVALWEELHRLLLLVFFVLFFFAVFKEASVCKVLGAR